MKDAYYLSRAYVEFGPFPAIEILGFYDRGLLKSSDYISGAGVHGSWIPVSDWVTVRKSPPKVTALKKSPAAAKGKPEVPPAAKPATAKKIAKPVAKKAKAPASK